MIRKAIKKPVEIKYITFEDLDAYWRGLTLSDEEIDILRPILQNNTRYITNEYSYEIKTLTGKVIMNKDYVLIIGVQGEIYPCRVDIFNETYEVKPNE